MARENHVTTSPQQQRWGTLEELLLACAVNRYGTDSWDLIALEVQNRSSTLSSFTPQNFRDKFKEIRRRFMAKNDAESTSLVPLVDHLRQIRLQELSAEVQRRDVLIVSLELEVKRLEEEREKSLKADADLERDVKASPDIIAAVEGDGYYNRSFNESNSTNHQAETTHKKQNDDVEMEEERDLKMKPEPDTVDDPIQIRTESKPDREDPDWSSNSNGISNENGYVKEETDDDNRKTASEGKLESIKNKMGVVGRHSEPNESKREGRQSSDAQSSASLSRNKCSRSGEESDDDEVSPVRKKVVAAKCEPLFRCLGMIRSHRLSSSFERRLRSQESHRYKKLVKQHMDLRIVQSRLDRGLYSNCFEKFFRDVLLLFNNFTIFFRKKSQEYAAARDLRATVIKEMADKLQKRRLIDVTKPKPKPKPKPKSTPEVMEKLPASVSVSNPKRASTMVVCEKRSSAKSGSENASNKKGDKKEREIEEKVKVKANEKRVGSVKEKSVKKKSDERSVSGRKNSRSGNNTGEVKHCCGGNELSPHHALEVKAENKKGTVVKKKQGAASFLKRMKQNSPSQVMESDHEESDNDKDNNDDDSEDKSKGSKVEDEKKRMSGRKRDVKSERVTRSSRGRGVREESGRVKRGVGRPPKRTASGPVSPPEKATETRGKDNGEREVGGGTRSRKRTKR